MEKKKQCTNIENEIIPTYWRNTCGSQSCRTQCHHPHFKDRKLEKRDMKWFIPVIQALKGKNPRPLFLSTALS